MKYAEALSEPSVVSKAQVARRFGVSRARVCQVLKLLELDDSILEFLKAANRDGEPAQVTERQLRPIAAVRDRKKQVRMFNPESNSGFTNSSVNRIQLIKSPVLPWKICGNFLERNRKQSGKLTAITTDLLEDYTTMCYYFKVNPDGVVQMDIVKFVESIVAKGRYHFTTEEAARETCVSHNAASAALRRLRNKGTIATPYQGFNLHVPPEYRRLGCLPPEQFVPQLMEHLGLDYYVGLLSAAEILGAAHQRPQKFQVMVAVNRPPLTCGEVRVRFIARRNVHEIPTIKKNTLRGYMNVASVEATAFDLIGYSYHSGGFSNVATVLAELSETMKADELVRIAPLSPIPWSQRLGCILDRVEASSIADPLAIHVAGTAREYVPLNTRREQKQGERSRRWKLIINDDVEPDL